MNEVTLEQSGLVKAQVLLNSFFESKKYIVFLSFLSIISWLLANFVTTSISFSTPYIFIVILVWLMCFSKTKPYALMPMFMLFFAGNVSMTFPYTKADIILLIIIGIPTLVLVGYKFSRTNVRANLKVLYENRIALSLGILVIVMFLSTVKSPVKLFTFVYAFVMLLTLFLYLASYLIAKNKNDIKHYMALSMIAFMYVIVIEFLINILVYYFQHDANLKLLWLALQKKEINIGWALGNHFAVIINMAIALCVYEFFTKKNLWYRIFLIVSAIVGLVTIVFTFSRGAYFGFFALAPVILISLFLTIKNKKIIYTTIGIVLAALGVVVFFFYRCGIVEKLIEVFEEKGMTTGTGRDELWDLAVYLFKKNWFLGTGWGTSYYYIEIILGRTENNYHNYILQASTCGILGIVSFLTVVFYLLKKVYSKNLYSLTMLAILVMFLVHGFVDTLFLNPILMSVLLILIGVVDDSNVTDNV